VRIELRRGGNRPPTTDPTRPTAADHHPPRAEPSRPNRTTAKAKPNHHQSRTEVSRCRNTEPQTEQSRSTQPHRAGARPKTAEEKSKKKQKKHLLFLKTMLRQNTKKNTSFLRKRVAKTQNHAAQKTRKKVKKQVAFFEKHAEETTVHQAEKKHKKKQKKTQIFLFFCLLFA
jgi:hypothetical protein